MPRLYQVIVTHSHEISLVVPDDMTDTDLRRIVRRNTDHILDAAHEADVEINLSETITLQEATDLDGDEHRINDARNGFVWGEDVDWIEGVITRGGN